MLWSSNWSIEFFCSHLWKCPQSIKALDLLQFFYIGNGKSFGEGNMHFLINRRLFIKFTTKRIRFIHFFFICVFNWMNLLCETVVCIQIQYALRLCFASEYNGFITLRKYTAANSLYLSHCTYGHFIWMVRF